MKLPAWGKALLDLRKAGQRPAFPVVVTDDWQIAYLVRDRLDWFALVCDPPAQRRDLSMLLDLEVMVVHSGKPEEVGAMVSAVRAARPRKVVLWESLAWLAMVRETIDALDRESVPA